MILDTCFLIDLQRGRAGAETFLQSNLSERLCITAISVGEYAAGIAPHDLPGLAVQLSHFEVLDVNTDAALAYGQTCRALKATGRMIGANDLWIASIALAHKMPVVTNNVIDFTRVPGLRVLGYA